MCDECGSDNEHLSVSVHRGEGASFIVAINVDEGSICISPSMARNVARVLLEAAHEADSLAIALQASLN